MLCQGFASINGDAVLLGTTIDDGGVRGIEPASVPKDLRNFLMSSPLAISKTDAENLLQLYNESSVVENFYQIRSDTCVVCPTKDLASLVSRTTLFPPVYAFMFRYAHLVGCTLVSLCV